MEVIICNSSVLKVRFSIFRLRTEKKVREVLSFHFQETRTNYLTTKLSNVNIVFVSHIFVLAHVQTLTVKLGS